MDYLYGKLCKYIEEKSYTLPVANSNTLGGIKADPRTENDTQEVKIDTTSGKLYTTSKTQSDWSASDADSPAYIKNKPTIPSLDGYATEQYVDNAIAAAISDIKSAINTTSDVNTE